MAEETKEQCKTCVFMYTQSYSGVRRCRRFPPQVYHNGYKTSEEQPRVYLDGWCGEYYPRESAPEKSDSEVTIRLSRRPEDKGLRIVSDDVSELILSGEDPKMVMTYVWPALVALNAEPK